MDLKLGLAVRKEVERMLDLSKLAAKTQLVVGDRGFRIDVSAGEMANKVRMALPLKVNGVAVIVVP